MQAFDVPIIHRHEDFIVVNKPVGLNVHREGEDPGLIEVVQQQHQLGDLWLVHRLDKVTSGLLILALNQTAAATLSGLFANKLIQKYYLALSDKKPKKKQGSIIGDMAKSRNGTFKLTQSKENPAITQFFNKAHNGYRWFVLKPLTGKTHQLRVALKSLGSPILGDTAYTGTVADRTYLHAYMLSFTYNGNIFDLKALPSSGGHFIDNLDSEALSDYASPDSLYWPKR